MEKEDVINKIEEYYNHTLVVDNEEFKKTFKTEKERKAFKAAIINIRNIFKKGGAPQDLGPIIKIFETWAVTDYGLECLESHYNIEKERLNEMDWIEHMTGKGEGVYGYHSDFIDAYKFACEYFKNG